MRVGTTEYAGKAEGFREVQDSCKSLHAAENHAKNFAEEFMQTVGNRLARRAGCGRIQTLRAFRRPQLDAWMLGCLDVLRIWGIRSNDRMGRIHKEDQYKINEKSL